MVLSKAVKQAVSSKTKGKASKPILGRQTAQPKGGGVAIRETYTLLPAESTQLDEIRSRLARLGWISSRSEIVRAGILALGQLKDDKKLEELMGTVPKLKTGRPA